MTVPSQPAGETALLVCGLQNDLCSGAGAFAAAGFDVSAIRTMLPAAETLLNAAREEGQLILHLPEEALRGGRSDSRTWREQRKLNGWPADALQHGSWGAGFVEGFEPRPGEPVVVRYRSAGLSDTRGSVLLRSAGIRRVVIVGVETHRAVLATAIQASSLDFDVVVPADAVAATDAARASAALDVLRSWAHVGEAADGDRSDRSVIGVGGSSH